MDRLPTTRSPLAGVFLLLALIVSLGMISVARLAPSPPAAGSATGTAAQWQQEAEKLLTNGQYTVAIEACRTGLVVEPWHPGLCLMLTSLLLQNGDPDDLRLWMDDLVMGDARQAEQLFELTGFSAKMDDPELQRIRREAHLQARD